MRVVATRPTRKKKKEIRETGKKKEEKNWIAIETSTAAQVIQSSPIRDHTTKLKDKCFKKMTKSPPGVVETSLGTR